MSPAAVESILQDFVNRARRIGATRPDGSELWRFAVDEHVYDLHYYPDDDTLIRRRLGGADAAREFTQLQALQKLGVPATRVIANLKGFRIGNRKGDACIVVHDPNALPLPLLASRVAAMDYPQRARLIAGVIQRMEELHRHRMTPSWPGRSQFGAAIFTRRGDGTIAIGDATARMNRRIEPADLIALDLSTRFCTTRTDRLRMWRHFTDERWTRGKASARRQLAGRIAAESVSGGAHSSHFGYVELDDGWRGTYLRRSPIALPWSNANGLTFDAESWRREMPTLFDARAAGWTAFKHDAAATVFGGRLTFEDESASDGQRMLDVVVKRPATPRGFPGFVKRLRPSRAHRACAKTWQMLGLGFRCELPLLLLERRRGPTWAEQLIVFERVPGPTLAEFDLASLQPDERDALLGDCGGVLGQIERAGFTHLDAKATNWIVWRDAGGRLRPVLIDLDGIRRIGPRGRGMSRLTRALRERPAFGDVELMSLQAGFDRGRR